MTDNKIHKKISRRTVTRQIGLATGFSLLGPSVARAGLVTPTQTDGPFYPIVEQDDKDLDLTLIDGHSNRADGETILVRGRVFDADGNALDDAIVDVWQANHHGRYSHPEDPNTQALDPNFQGWGIVHTDRSGRYGFRTIKPGAYSLEALGATGWRCRHIHFKVSRPGFDDLVTQMYFKGDPLIAQDLEIAEVPKEQQHLLIAESITDEATGLLQYQFDITLATAAG